MPPMCRFAYWLRESPIERHRAMFACETYAHSSLCIHRENIRLTVQPATDRRKYGFNIIPPAPLLLRSGEGGFQLTERREYLPPVVALALTHVGKIICKVEGFAEHFRRLAQPIA